MDDQNTNLVQTPAMEQAASIGFAHATTDLPSELSTNLTASLPIVSTPASADDAADTCNTPSGSCCGGSCGTPLPRKPVTTEFVDGHCESCGKTSQFPADRDGKIEECPHCHEFLDVGELDWEITDFGEPLD